MGKESFRKLLIIIAAMCMTLVAGFAFAAAKPVINECVTCHEKVSPQIVKDWMDCKMSTHFACDECHGKEHMSMTDFAKAKMPNAATCKKCHAKQVTQFMAGKHSKAWVAMNAMPKTASQPKELMEGMKGCGACHRIGYDGGKCDSCHTRHRFSKEEAKKPESCATCHMGFDHPQWEMYGTSKHGMIYQMEQRSDRGPTCATCHMDGGDHGVITSWGFLALRLPEDDPEWMAARVSILKAINVLDKDGKPTARLDVVVAGDVARLKKEDWQAPRDKMIKICSKCHATSYAKAELDKSDQIIKQADLLMADSIETVNALYRDGILVQPKESPFAVDLLTFYDAPTAIEQKLYVMLLEHRMRTFQGAFHMNPDYMHWYGWAEMKRDQAEIKEEAAKLRAEHDMKK